MNKQKLYEEILKKKGIVSPTGPVLMRREDSAPYRLSFAQRRIWFLQQFERESAAYNDPTALRIRGPLNISILERAFNEILRRHRVLGMTFPAEKGQPIQVPHKTASITIAVIEQQENIGVSTDRQISKFVNRYSAETFDLSRDQLIRVTLLKLAGDDYVLVVNIHHIVLDGWSKGIMLRELIELYEAFSQNKPSPLAELPVQYTDYIYWHHEWMGGKLYESQLAYWRKRLTGAPPVLELPSDHPRPNLPTGNGSLEPFSVSGDTFQALKELARQENVTLFMLLLATYNILLFRYSGQEDILVGTPLAGRQRVELEPLIGLFVNTLVMRTDLSGQPSFGTLLNRVRSAALQAFSHQDIPFEKLVEELNPQRNLSITPLFQVMFQLQNALMPAAQISGLTITPIQVDTGFAQVDLSLTLWEEERILKGTLEYSTDLYTSSFIKRMIGHFLVLLEGIATDVSQCICSLSLMREEEKRQLLVEWNDTAVDYPGQLSIYRLFAASVEKHPDEEAVIFGSHSSQPITYGWLNSQASQLAQRLQQMNIGPETLVAICLENSLQLIVGIMGILKAGGAYIPMDPQYPDKRLKLILNDARPPVLITGTGYVQRFSGYNGEILCLDEEKEETVGEGEGAGNFENNNKPGDAACVIYTSGSSGEPRGVVIENRNIVNLVYSFIRSYGPGPGDRILPLTSIASASFVGEVIPILSAGGGIVLADRDLFLDMKKLMQFLDAQRVTILSTVPSMIARLNGIEMRATTLRLLLSGGEVLTVADIHRLIKSVTIINGYGLTEVTICSTYNKVIESSQDFSINPAIPVGKPIINTTVYILDRYQNPVPIGIPGELHIGGNGIARGNLNHPELTNQKLLRGVQGGGFLEKSPPGCRRQAIYKTGDLGNWTEEGMIKFLGRIDRQVQIHGYRIECSEVESHLGLHPDIREAVVIDREIEPGDRRLVAYFTLAGENGKKGISPGSDQLREWLRQRIPDYMIPGVFLEVEIIPLNTNGKVDIDKLPTPRWERPGLGVDFKAPQTEMERLIAAVWQEFLRVKRVGINDNFFDLGGHSLLLMQVHGRLSEIEKIQSKKELTIVDLFRYSTIYSLAKYLEEDDPARRGGDGVPFRKIHDRAARQREAFRRKPLSARNQRDKR